MKHKLLFPTVLVALCLCNQMKANTLSNDSTKMFDSGNKRIIVTENTGKQRVEVEVFEKQGDGELLPYEKIFEGHYRDGRSSEQRKYLMSIDVPSPLPKKEFKSKSGYYSSPHHDASFGMGFAGFADKGDFSDIPFLYASSPEINFTMYYENALSSSNKKWGLVTGIGIRWVRYHLKGNHYFEEMDDYTHIMKAPDDWKFSKSKLGITTLNIPLLLEWKTRNNGFYLAAGAEFSLKTASSSRIFYKDRRGKKQKEKVDEGMTLRPITYDILVQGGLQDVGLFMRYSPISIFEKNKGPELYPLTFGLVVFFN